MSGRISEHLRSNIVGYIALFCFAFSGTAVALDGSNTVFSDDIVNNAVRSEDVRDDTLSNGGLAAVDLAPDSVGHSEVADDSLNRFDLAANSVGSSEIAPDSVGGIHYANDSIQALHLGAGSVGSEEVFFNSLGADDLAADSVGSEEIAASSVGASETAPDSVGQSEIVTNGVGGAEIATSSVGSSEVVDFGLGNQDVGVLYAKVQANGTVESSSGGVTVTKVSGVASYSVDFGRDIQNCGYAATPVNYAMQIGAADSTTSFEAVRVVVRDSGGGSEAAESFSLIVVC